MNRYPRGAKEFNGNLGTVGWKRTSGASSIPVMTSSTREAQPSKKNSFAFHGACGRAIAQSNPSEPFHATTCLFHLACEVCAKLTLCNGLQRHPVLIVSSAWKRQAFLQKQCQVRRIIGFVNADPHAQEPPSYRCHHSAPQHSPWQRLSRACDTLGWRQGIWPTRRNPTTCLLLARLRYP